MHLVLENLSKTYSPNVQALRGVDLSLQPGVLGLLGPNGAGKSTLMRILATLTRASSGRVLWNAAVIARDPDVLRAVLGYLPQDFGVYPNLNALEFLEYLAAVKGITAHAAKKRLAALLELVNLADAGGHALGGYSGGMRQRVGIAQALLNDPSTPHCRRAHGRSRSRGACQVSQSAFGAFRRTDRHPFDAHRL